MHGAEDKVIHLRERDAEGALECLNRITGLRFARWPQSLVPRLPQVGCEAPECALAEPVAPSVESA